MARKKAAQLGPVKLIDATLTDPVAEQVRKSHAAAITELQGAGGLVHENVVLEDDSDLVIAHALGRSPIFVYVSPPRNSVTTGRIVETRSTELDRSKFVKLGAYGWGADIIVDIWFM